MSNIDQSDSLPKRSVDPTNYATFNWACIGTTSSIDISEDETRTGPIEQYQAMINNRGEKIYECYAKHRDVTVSPLNDPVFYNMVRYARRLSTFMRWPDNINTSGAELADCGLFYLGYKDHLKCFSCGGLFQNWLPCDDPWLEHAKFYPTCPFLIKRKGLQYIRNVCYATPNIRRGSTKFDGEVELRDDCCTYV